MTEIKYKSKGNINDSPGGALQKSVPKPKNVHAEENKLFVAGLNNRELHLKELYENIRSTKDGDKLVELVKNGTIKPNERNGLGQCPLIFAVDCEFSIDVCKKLVSLGKCDPLSKDEAGDTLLHYALNLDNEEIEKWLLEDIKMDKHVKNNDGLTPYDE